VLDAADRNPGARWELYRVLAEPVRLRLLALAAEEELAIGELADLLAESQPNVSRHAAPLRHAGLLADRREGTRTFVRLADDARKDAVVADALASGRALCEADGSLAKVAIVVRAREEAAREFFARPSKQAAPAAPPSELGAYLAAFAPLLPSRALAVDAGTGDGGLLDVLAPIYERVVAIDRSDAQLERARERASARGFANVHFVHGDLDAPAIKRAVGAGADAVFASRLVHHAPKPAAFIAELADLLRPGGALVVIDYVRHDDESMREHEADVWLGFDAAELRRFARAAGLEDARIGTIAPQMTGRGPDHHLVWQTLVAKKATGKHRETEKKRNGASHG
jgi:ArsR family transcriptional regulator